MEVGQKSAEPKRRGRRPGTGDHLTPCEQRLLSYITVQTIQEGGAFCTKKHLAATLRCDIKTIDRCVARLRREKLIEVEPRHLPNGGQTGNMYRLVEWSAAEEKTQA